jgi:hypothetical protein
VTGIDLDRLVAGRRLEPRWMNGEATGELHGEQVTGGVESVRVVEPFDAGAGRHRVTGAFGRHRVGERGTESSGQLFHPDRAVRPEIECDRLCQYTVGGVGRDADEEVAQDVIA